MTPPDPKTSPRHTLLLVLVFLVARYAAAPVTGFVLDDWNYLALAQRHASLADAAVAGFAKDLNRPLSTAFMAMGFWAWGLHPAPYMLVLALGHLAVLLLATRLVRDLTGRADAAMVFGLAFAVFPLLTETFYFPMLAFNAATLGFPLYLASALAWTRFVRDGRKRWLAAAWIPYGIALFSYEVGALLPGAFAVLALGHRRHRETFWGLAGFALLLGFYLVWRRTEAFGYMISTTPAHMEGTVSPAHLLANAKTLVRWWVADRHALAWSQGFAAFAELPRGRQGVLALLNVGTVALVARFTRPLPAPAADPVPPFPPWRLLAFAATAFACASVPALMSYVESRLLVLPALAVLAVFARIGVGASGARWLRGTALALLFAALFADQGTNHSWRQSARAYRNILDHLHEHHAEWVDREYLIFDSRAFREGRHPDPIQAVAFQGNASLFRGSGLRELIWLARRQWPQGRGRLDVEYAAEYTGDSVILHGRFGEDRPPQHIPLGDCYLLPLREVVWGRD